MDTNVALLQVICELGNTIAQLRQREAQKDSLIDALQSQITRLRESLSRAHAPDGSEE